MTDTAEFLASLYQSLLGRPADAAGLDYWSEQLASGAMSPAQVVLAFSASAEAVQQVLPVAQLYLQVFGRSPDAEGLQYWLAQVRAGMSYRELVDNFQASAEFADVFGNLEAPSDFIRAAYQQLLGRAPDAQGLAHYVMQLEQGVSRSELLAELSLSAEASARVTAAVQTVVLSVGVQGRPPLPEELAEAVAHYEAQGVAGLEAVVSQWLMAAPQPQPDLQSPPGGAPEPLPEPALFTAPANAAGGSSDASTAVALDANYMVVGDDEATILRVYPREGGAAVLEWDFGAQLGNGGELDLEASVMLGDVLYLLGSHGNKKDGDEADSREVIVAVKVTGTGADTAFELLGQYTGMETALAAWDDADGHGLGNGALGLGASSANGQVPEQVSGFSMEGLAVSPSGDALWLGFRAPQQDLDTRDLALIVPLSNFAELTNNTLQQPEFGTPIQLDLGGRGIRSIELAADGSGYLIVAGPSGSASAAVARDFRLFTWTGDADAAPVELDNDLDGLLSVSGGSFETLVSPASILPGTRVQLLQDNGDTVWSGQSQVSKDLPNAEQQFQGDWVMLGQAYVDDAAPQVVQSTPGAATQGVAVDAGLTLTFDENVQRGEGVIELWNGSGELVQRFDVADAQQVRIDGHQVSVTPSQALNYETTYQWTVSSGAILDRSGNAFEGVSEQSALTFVTSGPPTELGAGDILFVAGNAEAPDAIAFILLKDISGGTRIQFSDRDYHETTGFSGIGNEMAFSWTAGQNLAAGTVVTIQTDVSGNPIADIGSVLGASGGIGKSETFYAMQNAVIDGLADGTAGEITVPGTFLASLTLGGQAGDIPSSLVAANAAFAFVATPANQTNARYVGSLDATDLDALAERIADPLNWEFDSTKVPGFALVNDSFYAMPLLRDAEVNEETLTLWWNQPLDAAALAEVGAFSVTVDGQAVAVQAIASSGETLTLTLAQAVAGGDIVNLTYTDPSAENDALALQSPSGVDVASFELGAIINRSPDDDAPELQSWSWGGPDDAVFHFANLVLEFDEVVEKGTGQIVFTPAEGEAIRVSVESAEVAIVGNTVTINPQALLAQGMNYQVGIEAGAFRDAAGNQHQGLVADSNTSFTTALAPSYTLLITEVNSNAKPADFFEVWNYGDTAVDLSGWRVFDNGSTFAEAVTLEGNLQLAAGQSLIVIMDKDATVIPDFRSAWSLGDDVVVAALDGPGLGKGDAVLMFDASGYLATGFNYGAAPVVVSDGSVVPTAAFGGSDGYQPGEHAGVVFGGDNAVDSAVWDGLDVAAPAYLNAVLNELGGVGQVGQSGAAGSPGFVPELVQDLFLG